MNKKRARKFRNRLERERQAILLSIQRTRSDEGKAGPGSGADEADIAADAHQTGLTLMLHHSGAARFKAITQALKRMDKGEWGLCAKCEEPIPEVRLEAVPWTTLCVHCQEQSERLAEHDTTPAQKVTLD